MQWSREQEDALRDVKAWLRSGGSPVFTLFGFAGTGKTTLAKHLAQDEGRVLFGAFTGKAASVLRSKGCDGAMTIHQMIYVPASKSKKRMEDLEAELAHLKSAEQPDLEKVRRIQQELDSEKKRLSRPGFVMNPAAPAKYADLIVIDECSMVDEQLGRDLVCFGVPVLVLGDPAQLPPVRGGGYFTRRAADVMLSEIHRQASDNPIIDLATRVRTGKTLLPGRYGDSQVIVGKPDPDLVMDCEQILTGKNSTRRNCNSRYRQRTGVDSTWHPVSGERVVCLRNNHDIGILNGTLWDVESSELIQDESRIRMTIRDVCDKNSVEVVAHPHYFQGKEDDTDWSLRDSEAFDFGYALTTHKAQGSQWSSVFIFDESYVFRGAESQWLYTAITRASDRVVISRSC
jgi:exodeoxyribonuclease V